MDKEFNRKCAEFMGYNLVANPFSKSGYSYNLGDGNGNIYYNPHDDLNQLIPIVDKLASEYRCGDYSSCGDSEMNDLIASFLHLPTKQALIDFVSEALK